MVRRAEGSLYAQQAPGDEEQEADPYQPGAARLGGVGGALQRGGGAVGGVARHLVGEFGADQCGGAQQQRGDGDDADDAGCQVGEGGHRPDPGDTAGAGGVGAFAGVVELDVGRLGPAQSQRAAGQQGDDHEQQQEQRRYRGGLPGEQDGRSGQGAAGAVEPVGDPLGDAAGHHPAERAGEHGDGGPGQSAQCGARVAVRAVEEVGDDGEHDDE